MLLTAVDHVAIAVRDLRAAEEFYRRSFGAEVVHRETVEEQGVNEALLRVGESFVQLLTPTRDDSPVGKFLSKKGEGIHHVAYRVADIRAALARLNREGVELIDKEPRSGSRGTTIAFVHPRGALGTLIELVQPPAAEGAPVPEGAAHG
jgi:methylmalonyl-CoA epimerase